MNERHAGALVMLAKTRPLATIAVLAKRALARLVIHAPHASTTTSRTGRA